MEREADVTLFLEGGLGTWGPLTTTPAPLLWTKNHISPFSEELAVDLLGSTKMMVERQLQYS